MNDIVNPQDIIAKQIASMRNRTQPTGGGIRNVTVTQDKNFVFQTGPDETEKKQGPIKVVLLDFINNNQFYAKQYVKGSNDAPDCWAQAWNIDDLAPDPKLVEEPVSKTCAECPMNEFGSAPNGSGKACKNNRRVAFMLPNDPDNIYIIKISPTGVGPFDTLMNKLASNNVPMCKIMMEMGFNPNKEYPSVVFEPVDEVSDKDFNRYATALARAQKVLSYLPKEVEEGE